MSKVRIYELAKDLNTNSKRLMEKLAEINIVVKNHMSYLEEDELNALYKHIGIVKHDDAKKPEEEEKKAAPSIQPKQEVKKDAKSIPRIIRTTEIIIDSKGKEEKLAPRTDFQRNDVRGDVRSNGRKDFIKKEDNNSGLRPGFTRNSVQDLKRDSAYAAANDQKKEPVKDTTKDAVKTENKQEVRQETKQELGKDTRQEQKVEKKAEANSAVETGGKPAVSVGEVKKQMAEEVEEIEKNETAKEKEAAVKKGTVQSGREVSTPEVQKAGDGVKKNKPETAGTAPAGPAQTNNRTLRGKDYGDRPQGGYNKPQGDRPQGSYNRSQRDKPQGGSNRPQGDRPQGGYNRPQSGNNRPQRDRPQGGYNRLQGDRPQGGYNRPQGDITQGGYSRPQGDRLQGGRYASKPLDIPKIDISDAQKEEELSSVRSEMRREFQNRDQDKDIKREQKKDIVKPSAVIKEKKFRPQKVVLNQKKGVSEILSEDFILSEFYDDDGRTKKSIKPKKGFGRDNKVIPPRAVLTSIKIPDTITVKDLAEALKKTSTEVIKKLMAAGVMATLNQEIDFDTAAIVADEFGVKAEKEIQINEEDILFDDTEEEDERNLVARPPVVVVMGHVDHGKTSLLDAIRKANVTESEAGGITQHIGAYTVKINNRNITFLDTPGHEAFTAMRARGAQVTDIAILVVAADDGVMPQTIEAINHAKAANVSIIVAINKIDKPGANPDRVKQELAEHGLVAEEWGGDVICVPVSAKKHENIDTLLEMILLAADMLELKANPNRQAKGTVIEAKLDRERGPIATVLVQRGTLNVGDSVVTGTTVGRIRAMVDDKGHKVKKAGPSTPVEILGLPEVPEAGEIFYAIEDEKVAKHLAEKRKLKQREQHLKATAKVSLDDLFNQIKEGKVKDLNIIVKADVQGSVEAVKQSLEKLSNEEVRVNIIHGGVGAITESDVTLAQVSNAIIIGFNVRPGTNVSDAAKNAGVDLRLYRVIYNAIEDIEAAMKGMLEPTFKEVVQGHAEIRQIFKVSGVGTIGGAYVTDGKIMRNSEVRIIRDSIVVHEGKLASLKRFKDDAKEVAQGFECGLSVERFNDIKEGDVVESFVMEEVAR